MTRAASANLFHRSSLFHAVENLLRAGLRAIPDAEAAALLQALKNGGIDKIDPAQAFVGMLRVSLFHFLKELHRPLLVDGQHIVGNPHDVRVVLLFDHQHFVHNVLRRTLPMGMTKYFATNTMRSETDILEP